MAKKQQHHRPKRNFFTNNNKPVESMTAADFAFAADRIFRDLAKGNFDPMDDADKFKNPQLLASLIAEAQTRFIEANLINNSMEFCFNDAVKRNLNVDPNAAAIKNKWQNLAGAYGLIVAELQMIQVDGDAYTHLAKITQQLWKAKHYFR